VAPIHLISGHWIIRFGVLSQAASEAKVSSGFKDAIHSIWSALSEKASNDVVKDYCKRLAACVVS